MPNAARHSLTQAQTQALQALAAAPSKPLTQAELEQLHKLSGAELHSLLKSRFIAISQPWPNEPRRYYCTARGQYAIQANAADAAAKAKRQEAAAQHKAAQLAKKIAMQKEATNAANRLAEALKSKQTWAQTAPKAPPRRVVHGPSCSRPGYTPPNATPARQGANDYLRHPSQIGGQPRYFDLPSGQWHNKPAACTGATA